MKTVVALALGAVPLAAFAQTQVVKPPIAVYWMSVETAAGMGGMGGMGGAMAGMMGGGAMQGGKRMHLELGSQKSAEGAPKAEHDIPPAVQMGAMLPLVTPVREPAPRGERTTPREMERPKGRMLVYWGCGENVRAGQPVIIDFAKVSEGSTPPNLVAHRVNVPTGPAYGRSRTYGEWPNPEDSKRVPEGSSLVGDHAVKGNYSPDIRFALDDKHDFMAALALANAAKGAGAQSVTWNSVPTATGYFAMVYGAQSQEEVVMWSSSEVQDMGSQLMDYIPPAEVARLIREKVVMPPSTTECTVPAEVVKKAGGSPFLNFIAYGPEANFAEPPRPKDPKVAWEPLWATKVRFKSTGMLLLGESAGRGERRSRPERAPAQQDKDQQPASTPQQPAIPDPVNEGINKLRGIFGR